MPACPARSLKAGRRSWMKHPPGNDEDQHQPHARHAFEKPKRLPEMIGLDRADCGGGVIVIENLLEGLLRIKRSNAPDVFIAREAGDVAEEGEARRGLGKARRDRAKAE